LRIIFTIILLGYTINISAQDIRIRTVPLITADRAVIHPSLSAGMGYLSAAVHDTLSDPFVNPAAAVRITNGVLFISPSRSTWTNDDGRAISRGFGLSTKYTGTVINTLPFGFYVNSHEFFAGGVFAHQLYSSERVTPPAWYAPASLTKQDKGNNSYIFGLAGAYIPGLKLAVAGSITWKDYKAIDGVNVLYPGSYDITQDGWSIEYKLGAYGKLSGKDEIEFVIGRSMMKSSHTVTTPAILWFDDTVPPADLLTYYYTETNKDETEAWLIHTKYNYSVSDKWTLGSIITVNWKEHPKIPNYPLAGIPRDPGNSTAYNLGIGAAYNSGRKTAGIEYIYEPITSYTWAEAGENRGLPASFKITENYFDFTNHLFRAGLKNRTGFEWLDYSLGVQLHFYHYKIKQDNNLNMTSFNNKENWLEAVLTGGLFFNFPGFRLQYLMQVTLGNGLIDSGSNPVLLDSANSINDFLIAPGHFTVEAIPVITQQLSVIYQL
jgi:hypothetical protein